MERKSLVLTLLSLGLALGVLLSRHIDSISVAAAQAPAPSAVQVPPHTVAPAAPQPPAPRPKRYEHRCTELSWEEVLGNQPLKADLGKNGWELATFVSAEKKAFGGPTTRIVACFKREIP